VDEATARTYKVGINSNHGYQSMTALDDRQANRIAKLCAEHGLRMTGQRRTIARVLSEAVDHPNVEEVHARAHRLDHRISLSTVYRTLRLFEQKGILARHEFGEGRRRYEEANSEHHDHLIDVDGGRVIEFRSEEIEKLQERIARELGFKLVGHRLELYGVPLRKKK
jgi:Fur family transcriptional regulator, ferric uptake regulator